MTKVAYNLYKCILNPIVDINVSHWYNMNNRRFAQNDGVYMPVY